MSLKTVYDNSNKVTETGLSVTYRQSYNGRYWEISRFAKKSYSFVGMDKTTAYECASAKRTQYTRAFKRINEDSNGLPVIVNVIECPSDIAPRHVEGNAWSVEIAVNEESVIGQASMAQDPASLFATENGWNYDENAAASTITLQSAQRDSRDSTVLVCVYTSTIPDYDPDRFIVQWKTESETSWHNGTTIPETGALSVRVVYGQIESNTLTIS